MGENKTFDYSTIPLGYYDKIAARRKGMRSFWHYLKFKRIIDVFGINNDSILDIGCFAGTFLGMIPESTFKVQYGIDILKDQVEYANDKYGNDFRKFFLFEDFKKEDVYAERRFDVITLLEVIEHLTTTQIADIISIVYTNLKLDGRLIITTPNYASAWPLLEVILNKVSDVKYVEQHITRFNYYNFFDKIGRIVPGFSEMFQPDFKTTTHLLTPYIAGISFKTADRISSAIPHANWKFPLGALLIVQLRKTSVNSTTMLNH